MTGGGNATRRRYAHDLRRLCDSESVDGCVRLDAALDELGLGTAYWVPCHDVERLADLIDRPTCTPEVGLERQTCSECDAECIDGWANFCPNCGAEVVR